MLQSLGGLLNGDGHAAQIVLAVVVLVVLIGLLYVLYRLLFAHRLRAPSGTRARGSRLGVVDVYGLDGQRQLVIVRRDNVEHLLMIGGPNDVVVEGNIVRATTNGAVRDAARRRKANRPRSCRPRLSRDRLRRRPCRT
jgi:flagellar protein FliO/FliZ